jgi:ring-1,2-phenylacetyl-CoA epoxidase subunit PaaB
MSDEDERTDAESDTLQLEPDPEEESVAPYEVLVQWKRGAPHEHAETIDAPTDRMALLLAKRNIDTRQEPLSIWVVPREEVSRTQPEDPTLKFGTDRSYRNISWYAENKVEIPDQQAEKPLADGSNQQES